MMAATATNDVTGDRLTSKGNSDKFRESFDQIFGKKETLVSEPKRFKDRTKLGISPSSEVETWDCRTETEKAAESLLSLRYDGNKIEPTL